ncbi:MAG TPA: class E sortase [Streptosporangiaceae bacterium]|nr:class E sortase [Streptosporangiaceae bacterium]
MRKLTLLAVLCLAGGALLLARGAYIIWDPGAATVQHQLTATMHRQWQRDPGSDNPLLAMRLRPGQPFASIMIPRFGPDWRFTIVQGTSLVQLATGPGHVLGTQYPGEPGNFAVAAHDITAGNPFLHLGTLRAGDQVIVQTAYGTYTYKVLYRQVVRYTDAAVLAPVPGDPGVRPTAQYITLITCTPVTLAFTPWRIVVTGVLTHTAPAAHHAAERRHSKALSRRGDRDGAAAQ